jgi:triacylglycerol esterase/lipase EstA (alpha/beta hydrolase family)
VPAVKHERIRDHRMRAAVSSAVASAVAVTALLARPAVASDYPVIYNWPLGVTVLSTLHPVPPGANDWSCRPSAAHPYPIVLVHALGSTSSDWQAAAPLLANNGYCVFALDYGGDNGQGDLVRSAQQLSDYVDKVLAATGAPKVDLVGHSQGGMFPRYYLKYLGGAPKVDALIAIVPTNHGTTLYGAAPLVQQAPGVTDTTDQTFGPAYAQNLAGSPFMNKLNKGPDTVPGPRYVVLGTKYDDIATPYDSVFLKGPNVTNILLQDVCHLDYIEHLAASYDSIALHLVLNSLDPAHATKADCHPVLPAMGG